MCFAFAGVNTSDRQRPEQGKQIMVFTVALALAWLLTSCVAWCTLVNGSESQFTHLQNVDNNTPVPLSLPSTRKLNGIRPGGKNRHTQCWLS